MSSSSAYDHHVSMAVRTFPKHANHYTDREHGVRQHAGWTCSHCDTLNNRGRSKCSRCQAYRFDSKDQVHEFHGSMQQTQHPAQRGRHDWNCKQCGYENSEFHSACLNCKNPRIHEETKQETRFGEPVSRDHWNCECGVLNDGNRVYCQRCRRPPAQWECKSCTSVNAGNRHFCHKCLRPKNHTPHTKQQGFLPDISRNLNSSSPTAQEMQQMQQQFQNSQSRSPSAGWLCSCGAENNKGRARCYNCRGYRFNALAHAVDQKLVDKIQSTTMKTYEPLNSVYGSGEQLRFAAQAVSAQR